MGILIKQPRPIRGLHKQGDTEKKGVHHGKR